jgi:hypothetical protein
VAGRSREARRNSERQKVTTKPRAVASLILPIAPAKYDERDQTQVRQQLHELAKKVQPLQQKQLVTGAKGANAALTSLLAALVKLGFITDSTT